MGLLTRVVTGGVSGGAEGGGEGILAGFMRKKKKPKSDEGAEEPLSFKHGGKVPKTGMAKVHKGEVVLTKRQAKSHRKMCGK